MHAQETRENASAGYASIGFGASRGCVAWALQISFASVNTARRGGW
jgi:hypothetical protein